MSEKSEVIPVDDIAHDDERLTRIVQSKVKKAVVLDTDWTVGVNLECVDPTIPALLINKASAWGAVRVDTSPVLNEVTGPGQSGIFAIIIKPGETCRFYQQPSIRYFRYTR
ncbi:hypothetical protein MaudMau93_007892 [Microsporum audouinii]